MGSLTNTAAAQPSRQPPSPILKSCVEWGGDSNQVVKMRGQIIVAATNFVQRGGLSSAVKLRPNDGWMYASTSRNFVTSSIRLDDKDDKVSDQANLAKSSREKEVRRCKA